jgi:hypothetical protein
MRIDPALGLSPDQWQPFDGFGALMRHDSDDRLHASSEDAAFVITLRLTADGSAQRSSQNCELPSVRRASVYASNLFRPFCSAPQNVDFCVGQ